MARDDWYRRTTWSEEDAREFDERLARSRSSFHKAQYLRIQAATLAETGDAYSARIALQLLQRLFSEFPEPSELSAAHLQAAQCHEHLGNTSDALAHLTESLKAQSSYPNTSTGVSLEYPWFVARHKLSSQYSQALSTLEGAHLAFPVAAFKAAASRALIAQDKGEPCASKYALEALEAAEQKQSKFTYHRSLGLVGKSYASTVKQLRTIAAA